jgi:hypothetical protein
MHSAVVALGGQWAGLVRLDCETLANLSERRRVYAYGSPKDGPHFGGAIGGDSDRSATGILDAHPFGFRTRNV